MGRQGTPTNTIHSLRGNVQHVFTMTSYLYFIPKIKKRTHTHTTFLFHPIKRDVNLVAPFRDSRDPQKHPKLDTIQLTRQVGTATLSFNKKSGPSDKMIPFTDVDLAFS